MIVELSLTMPLIEDTSYEAPFLIANRHVSTLVPNLLRFPRGVKYDRERIETIDGDFLDIDWSRIESDKLVIFSHGLEGNTKKAYILGMVRYFNKLGWDALAWNFRSCSGEPNLKESFYHPGQTDDMHAVVQHALEKHPYQKVVLVGFSLGGAYTLRYLGERSAELPAEVKKAIVFSTPTDLSASSQHLSKGSNTWYGRAFLYKFKRKILQKERLRPGTYDLSVWDKIKTVSDFDAHFNTNWYGFDSVEDFYHAGSAKPVLHRIETPTLIVNAENDPFLPDSCYPKEEAESNENLFLEIPSAGGHVGFMSFKWKGVYWSEARAGAFLEDLM